MRIISKIRNSYKVGQLKNKLALVEQIGFWGWLKYKLATDQSIVRIKLNNNPIWVRKGTPDLDVAISCLIEDEFKLLERYMPKDFAGIIIDAGGYIGTSTIALKNMFPLAKIIVIEPSDENLKLLKMNIQKLTNIQIHHAALVGEDVKEKTLKNRGTGEWGFTIVENPADNNNSISLHKCNAIRISDLVTDESEIGCLKLDIEGGEFDLISNDFLTLSKIKLVFAELHDRIVPGCSDCFFEFSKNRKLVKDRGEKYLSVKN